MLLVLKWILSHWQQLAIAAIIAALVGFGYYIKGVISENKALKIEIALKETRILSMQKDLNGIANSIISQNIELGRLEAKITQINSEAKQANQIFKKHNLSKISEKKPALVEKKVNLATQRIFMIIVQDTEDFYRKVNE